MNDIISKLKESGLTGRGGAGFPTATKWESVMAASGEAKYVICNASEGEPNVFKDGFILENYPQVLIEGIILAMETVKAKAGYIYLKYDYFDKYGPKLKELIADKSITLFRKPHEYIAGEETVICNLIEGKRMEPCQRPPFISTAGLFGCPTLMNNVETFYYVAKINKGEYKNTRFYSINGKIKNPGVYELPVDLTINQILTQTNNVPDFDFFLQVGGGAVGEILLVNEIDKPATGAASITVFDKNTTDIYKMMDELADFFLNGNCDKCVPCREGIYRIKTLLKEKNIDLNDLELLFQNLEKASFCALGKGAPTGFRGLLKVLAN
ncbi:MAG: NADH-ubiquinone oxidoreductase-F iron-sulfur binding region domain-containing protein [Candidatus Paceibacterota bacterium]|jgi:NADH:ubiquinone oxidoreductase subunit F (NADH-binding)